MREQQLQRDYLPQEHVQVRRQRGTPNPGRHIHVSGVMVCT